MPSYRCSVLLPVLLITALLSGCGGGGTSSTPALAAPPIPVPTPLTGEPGAPRFTGDTAQDGFNWFNYRRQQLGIPLLQQNSLINAAAQGHANYQAVNGAITHDQTPGLPGFTGAALLDRLTAANYHFSPQASYAYGEVISAGGDASGFYMAEELITAIYHRFVILEPVFKEAGAGAATSTSNGTIYFTADFAANNGYGPGIGRNNVVTYPFASQQHVPAIFYSDFESPDPVPNQNQVGFPISIHANIDAILTVQTFSVQPHGGAPMTVQLMTADRDRETPRSAAAIIPLSVLASNTTYDVLFVGTVNNIAITRTWSFTTQ